jgi:signal recognition particle subunit SEC65
MRLRKPFLIFWPQYFDGKRSRSGYNATIEQGYKYSRTWWDDPGRVVLDAKGKKKSKILLEIAKEVRKLHSKS